MADSGSARQVGRRVTDAAREAGRTVDRSPWLPRMARVGYVAMGVSYAIVAVLAIRLALGEGGETTSRSGALATLADEPFGRTLLVLLAIGFAGYAAWRLAQAVLDREHEGSDASGLARRATYVGQAVVYAGLLVATVRILSGDGGGGGGNRGEQRATATALDWPGGRWIVGLVGVAVIGAAAYQAYRGLTRAFLEKLEVGRMSATERRWIERLGIVGLLARALVFALIGVFVVKAAYEYSAREAIGLDGALSKLAQAGHGPWLLGLTALGLLAYALFCVAQARFRTV